MRAYLPIPAITASHAGIWRADADGQSTAISAAEARRHLAETPHLLLGAPQAAMRIGLPDLVGLDLLELWAFVYPARFLVPSAAGLAAELGLDTPARESEAAGFYQQAAARLLDNMAAPDWVAATGARQSLERLHRKGWIWAPLALDVLPEQRRAPSLFHALPEWQDPPPRTAPILRQFADSEAEQQLHQIAGPDRPPRDGQSAYATAALQAFQPRTTRHGPNLVVAEAGTGIGKTLGYLAPASLYTRETGGSVWLSTYTRALQRQLRAETERSLPILSQTGGIIVRKGRENYLCLLNLEDAIEGSFSGRHGIFAELVARWARWTADGDMVGGDLPGWLPGLFRQGQALPALSDRRGECIHAACPHYRRCFIERSVRQSAEADLVIANHALVMANVVHGRTEREVSRIVFDEGHHLQAAADSAFAIALTGRELLELRRWLLGPDARQKRPARRRGLAPRLMDVTSHDETGDQLLDDVLEQARKLPSTGWLGRIAEDASAGPIEGFLAAVRQRVLTQGNDVDRGYTLEAPVDAPDATLADATQQARDALQQLALAMQRLHARLNDIAHSQPDWLDQSGIARIEAAMDGLTLRRDQITGWLSLLHQVMTDEADLRFVDWFTLVRHEGREMDSGLMRHWLDPLRPLADHVLTPAHGVLVTSATLADPLETAADGGHLPVEARLFRAPSPFDYGAQARIWVATDVNRHSITSLAHAYATLIEAAGGGTLGLFTAIARLRAVHGRIADRLAAQGLPIHAQHVDAIDTGTLVDLFRADARSSLLGTDALRDGVDVPGDSLRLLIFEGVPWSRPTILHQARKQAFGGSVYEDRLVGQRLQQAFGRLIRNRHDRGGFVLLGPQVPSRLLQTLPPEVPVERLPLDEVAAAVTAFLQQRLRRDCSQPSTTLGQECNGVRN